MSIKRDRIINFTQTHNTYTKEELRNAYFGPELKKLQDFWKKCDEGRFAKKFYEENGYWPPSVQTAMERYTKSLAAARLHKEGIETVPLYSSGSDPFEAVTYKAGGEQPTWAEEISTLRRAQNESQRVFEQRTKAITSGVLKKKISKMQTQNMMLFELELKELTLEAV